jgi:hypothetical protein
VRQNPLDALLWLARVLVESPASSGPRARWTKLGEWLRRYGPAECGGIAGALVGSFLVRRVTGSAIAAAYGGAWGETLGYATVMLVRDVIAEQRVAHSSRGAFHVRDIGRVIGGLVAEFGPAGVLDSFVTRPLAMGLGVRTFGLGLGIIVGKIAADVLFYIPVIVIYEYRLRRARRRGVTEPR